MNTDLIENLGPLAGLAGTWEGASGHDVAPSDDRGTEENHFRERMTFIPFGPVDNHEQKLYGLKYSTFAWRKGEEAPSFHEELGYWLWDARDRQVMRCFSIPRGVTLLAGGTVEPHAHDFHLSAVIGSVTYGILSNPFLDREFKTVRYDLKIEFQGKDRFIYDEDTQLQIPGRPEIFHHTDKNVMTKVANCEVQSQ